MIGWLATAVAMGTSLGTALLLRSSGNAGRLAWLGVHALLMLGVRWAGSDWGVVGLAAFGLQILRMPGDTSVWTLLARLFWPTRIAGGPILPPVLQPLPDGGASRGLGLIALGLFEWLVVAGGFTAWTGDAFDGHGPIGVVPVFAALIGFTVRVVFELAGLWHLTLGLLAWTGRRCEPPGANAIGVAPGPFFGAWADGPFAMLRRVAPGFADLLTQVAEGREPALAMLPLPNRLVAAGLFVGVLALDPMWTVAATLLVLATALHNGVGHRVGFPVFVVAGGLAALLAGSPTPRRAAWMFDGACGRFGIDLDASGLLAMGMGVMVLTFGPRTPSPGSWLGHPVTAGILAGTAIACVPWAHLPLVFQL